MTTFVMNNSSLFLNLASFNAGLHLQFTHVLITLSCIFEELILVSSSNVMKGIERMHKMTQLEFK